MDSTLFFSTHIIFIIHVNQRFIQMSFFSQTLYYYYHYSISSLSLSLSTSTFSVNEYGISISRRKMWVKNHCMQIKLAFHYQSKRTRECGENSRDQTERLRMEHTPKHMLNQLKYTIHFKWSIKNEVGFFALRCCQSCYILALIVTVTFSIAIDSVRLSITNTPIVRTNTQSS